jgi:ribosomal protein S18 acetylase RimI-like enzyme
MPTLQDKSAIRKSLNRDRAWSVYALGDLAPGLFEHTTWHATDGDESLLMLFRAFDTPVLFTIGAPAGVAALLDEISAQRKLYLSVRPEILPLIHARYSVRHETLMWRMVLDRARFTARPTSAARLALTDYPALTRLHADGEAAGEAPDFFAPYMVEQGVFYGIYEGQELVATAGTHLVAPSEGVAAVGNVYTRGDQRGRGLAGQVTSAVVAELLRLLPFGAIIALNVMQANAPAVKLYERLGFARHCGFYEGVAE